MTHGFRMLVTRELKGRNSERGRERGTKGRKWKIERLVVFVLVAYSSKYVYNNMFTYLPRMKEGSIT